MKDELSEDERKEKIAELGANMVNCISDANDGSMTIEVVYSSVLRLFCSVAATMASTTSDAQGLKVFPNAVLKDVKNELLEALGKTDRKANLN